MPLGVVTYKKVKKKSELSSSLRVLTQIETEKIAEKNAEE